MWDKINSPFVWTRNNLLSKYGLVSFKLLHDLLILSLAFFFVLVVADGILPGIISNYYDPAIVVLLVLVNIFLISFLEKSLKLDVKHKSNKKTAIFMLLILVLLISNTFFRLNIWLNFFLTLLSFLIGFFIYRVFTEE